MTRALKKKKAHLLNVLLSSEVVRLTVIAVPMLLCPTPPNKKLFKTTDIVFKIPNYTH